MYLLFEDALKNQRIINVLEKCFNEIQGILAHLPQTPNYRMDMGRFISYKMRNALIPEFSCDNAITFQEGLGKSSDFLYTTPISGLPQSVSVKTHKSRIFNNEGYLTTRISVKNSRGGNKDKETLKSEFLQEPGFDYLMIVQRPSETVKFTVALLKAINILPEFISIANGEINLEVLRDDVWTIFYRSNTFLTLEYKCSDHRTRQGCVEEAYIEYLQKISNICILK